MPAVARLRAPNMNNAHEVERLDRIAKNRAKMEEMGLFQVRPEPGTYSLRSAVRLCLKIAAEQHNRLPGRLTQHSRDHDIRLDVAVGTSPSAGGCCRA